MHETAWKSALPEEMPMSETTAPRSEPPLAPDTAVSDEDSGRLSSASTGRLVAILVALVLFSEVVPLQYTMVGVIIPKIGAPAVTYGVVRDLMPRRWIPICIGFIGTGFGVASIIAPLVGGGLTDHYSWRAVFWFLGSPTSAAATSTA